MVLRLTTLGVLVAEQGRMGEPGTEFAVRPFLPIEGDARVWEGRGSEPRVQGEGTGFRVDVEDHPSAMSDCHPSG